MKTGPLIICAVGAAESVHVAARTRCFAERGHRVYLITERASVHEIPGVTQIVPTSRTTGASNPVAHLRRAAAFLTLLRRIRPDIVHVHYAYNYYGWLAALLGAKPLAVSVMGGDVLFDEQGQPSRLGKWLTVELLRQADYITAKSGYLIEVLDALGQFGAKAERIVWGISPREFRHVDTAALRAKLGIAPAQRVILSPKILQPFYRVHLIVEAMRIVSASNPNALLLITEYGADAAYRAKIEARICELGLAGNVRFCGRVQHEDMPAYYSLAEMTVSVPSSDGLPQTLLEGMACGTPSILSRLPRYEEVVAHRVSAYFVEPEPQSIAAGITELLENQEFARSITSNAAQIVQRDANLEEQAERVERRFRQLANTAAPRAWSARRMLQAVVAYCRFALNTP